jgi:hypothetical protein
VGVAVPKAVEEFFKLLVFVRRGVPAFAEPGPQARADLVVVVRADPGEVFA